MHMMGAKFCIISTQSVHRTENGRESCGEWLGDNGTEWNDHLFPSAYWYQSTPDVSNSTRRCCVLATTMKMIRRQPIKELISEFPTFTRTNSAPCLWKFRKQWLNLGVKGFNPSNPGTREWYWWLSLWHIDVFVVKCRIRCSTYPHYQSTAMHNGLSWGRELLKYRTAKQGVIRVDFGLAMHFPGWEIGDHKMNDSSPTGCSCWIRTVWSYR